MTEEVAQTKRAKRRYNVRRREALKTLDAQLNVADWMIQALDGEELSEFALSCQPVRRVVEMRETLARAVKGLLTSLEKA